MGEDGGACLFPHFSPCRSLPGTVCPAVRYCKYPGSSCLEHGPTKPSLSDQWSVHSFATKKRQKNKCSHKLFVCTLAARVRGPPTPLPPPTTHHPQSRTAAAHARVFLPNAGGCGEGGREGRQGGRGSGWGESLRKIDKKKQQKRCRAKFIRLHQTLSCLSPSHLSPHGESRSLLQRRTASELVHVSTV